MNAQSQSSNEIRQGGFTLVELMVAMTISLFMVGGLVSLFVNTSRTNSEMAKTNLLIEDGRIAVQVLSEDLVHAGFWGGYLPNFDDLTYSGVPTDVPSAAPNPCQTYATWGAQYELNVLGVAVQSSDTLPAGAGCLSPLVKNAASDVLVVRHIDTCIPGAGNCDPDVVGRIYFQFPLCENEKNQTAQNGTFNTLTLDPNALAAANAYVGATVQTTGGAGGGQYRKVTAYTASRVATVDSNWSTTPNNTTTYALRYMLGSSAFQLHRRDCTTVTDKRRLVSNLYYVTNMVQNGVTVPTLVRSQFDYVGGALAQQAPVALVEGIEAFRVVVGIDNVSKSGAAVDYTAAVNWSDPTAKTTATNRGDGAPDIFKRCTTLAPCTLADQLNIVAVKLFVLTRTREPTRGHTDTKAYCINEPQPNGSCAGADTVGPFNDSYKRHLFTTSIRLTNISGRRDTP